jgi:hypothetical protein
MTTHIFLTLGLREEVVRANETADAVVDRDRATAERPPQVRKGPLLRSRRFDPAPSSIPGTGAAPPVRWPSTAAKGSGPDSGMPGWKATWPAPPAIDKPSHELPGELLLEAGKPAEAQEYFETALSRTPGRIPALRGLERTREASAATGR